MQTIIKRSNYDNPFYLSSKWSSKLPKKCLHHSCKNEKWLKQHQSHIQNSKSSLQAAIFAILIDYLNGRTRNLKFKQIYQQYCLCVLDYLTISYDYAFTQELLNEELHLLWNVQRGRKSTRSLKSTRIMQEICDFFTCNNSTYQFHQT